MKKKKKKTSTTEHSRYDSHTALEGALHCSPAAYKVNSDVVCHLSPFYLSPPFFQSAPPLALHALAQIHGLSWGPSLQAALSVLQAAFSQCQRPAHMPFKAC